MTLLNRFYCAGLCLFLVGIDVASAQPICPSQNFNAFIKAFGGDEHIQQSFVANPLKIVSIDSNENGQFIQKVKKVDIHQNQVNFAFPVYKDQRWIDGGVQIKRRHNRFYQVNNLMNGVVYTYDFKKTNRCWYMTRFVNPSL